LGETGKLVAAIVLASLVTAGSLVYAGQEMIWAETGDEPPPLDEPFGPVFPRFKRAPILYAVKVTDLSYEQKLVLVSLQGIVNKESSALYLEYRPNHWLEFLNDTYGQEYRYISHEDAIAMFGDRASGLIVFDPEAPTTVNVATTLSAIHGYIITAPDLVPWVSGITGLDVVMDLREGEWAEVSGSPNVYLKVLEDLYPSLRQDVFAMLIPTKVYLRDYIISLGVMCVDINPGPFITPEEDLMVAKLLDTVPPQSTIIGWFDDPSKVEENIGVQRFSKHGNTMVPADNMPNLSVFAAYDFKEEPKPRAPAIRQAPALEDKVYLTFVFSDGDNIAFMHNEYVDVWGTSVRGTVPIGWSMATLATEIAPPIYEYYSSTMTQNDTLVAAPSGSGYFYPDFMPEEDLGPTMARSRLLMDAGGTDSIWVLNSFKAQEVEYSEETIAAYTDHLEPTGVFLDYGDAPTTKPYWIGEGEHHSGTPFIRATHMWEDPDNFIAKVQVARDTVKTRPYFIFAAVHVWSIGPDDVMAVIEALNATKPESDFKIVSANDFFALIQAAEVEKAREGLDKLNELPHNLLQRERADIQVEVEAAERALRKGRLDSAATHALNANQMLRKITMDVVTAVTVVFTLSFAAVLAALLYLSRRGALKRRLKRRKRSLIYVPKRAQYSEAVMIFASGCAALLACFRVIYSYYWDLPAFAIAGGLAVGFKPLAASERYQEISMRQRLVAGTALAFAFSMATVLLSTYFVPVCLFGFMMVVEASPTVRREGPTALMVPMVLAMIVAGLTRTQPMSSLVFGTWALCLGASMPIKEVKKAKRSRKWKIDKKDKDAPMSPTLFLVIALMAFYIPSSRYLALKTGDLEMYLWNLFIIIPLGAMLIAFLFSDNVKPTIESKHLKRKRPGALERGTLVTMAALAFGALFFTYDPIALSLLILLGQASIMSLALITMPRKWLPTYPPYLARDIVLLFIVMNMLFIVPVIFYTLYIAKLGVLLNYLLYTFPIMFAVGLAIMIVPVAMYWREE
jgi:hypothetical protein